MAEESSQSQEKTEEATPKRLREARKKGQVAKSKDMNTLVILVVAFGLLGMMIPYFHQNIDRLLHDSFSFASAPNLQTEKLIQFLSETFWSFIKMTYPFLVVLMVVAIMVGFFQIGAIFSTEPLKPQMKRLNIVENVKNMAKIKTLVELLKNIVKVTFIFLIAYYVVKSHFVQLILTAGAELDMSTLVAKDILVDFMVRVFVLFLIIAIIDVGVERWNYKKQLRMTRDEVKREYKQDEGDPIIKSVRRQLHQELAMGDARSAVAASDAVITNPIHLAVAVKYNEAEMNAPTVMMKGQRQFAEKLKEYAKEAGVPVIQNVPLAWALNDVEIEEEIPEELYQAMAEVLALVYKMRESVV